MTKPVIICLHGRGANAEIFEIQSMPLVSLLEDQFEFIFIDAPNECQAGPNILPTFEDEAPFYSWLGNGSLSPGASKSEAIEETVHLVNDIEISTPNIVGVLGFSQGAAVGLGLLCRDQRRRMMGLPSVGYRFGIFAGEVRLPVLFEHEYLDSGASTPSEYNSGRPFLGLATPTIHATGRLDALAAKGTTLARSEIGTNATLFAYDGGHEMPRKAQDVRYLAQHIESLYTKSQNII